MAMTARRWMAVLGALILLAALAYLRDPPWLVRVTSGLTAWASDPDGTRYRWTAGHGSFFVPAAAGTVTLHVRSPKDDPRDWPITATITIDDRRANVLTVPHDKWQTVQLRLPPPGDRKVRRIDIKLDRVRTGNRGIQLQVDGW